MFNKFLSFFRKKTHTDFNSSKSEVFEPNNIPVEDSASNQDSAVGVAEFMIKGNINTKGDKIYHLPNGRFYKQVQQPSEIFHSEEEAETAGYRRSRM